MMRNCRSTPWGRLSMKKGSIYFCDGSGGAHPTTWRLMRCGWACARFVDEDRVPVFKGAFFGGLPGAKQSVPRAEFLR